MNKWAIDLTLWTQKFSIPVAPCYQEAGKGLICYLQISIALLILQLNVKDWSVSLDEV
jgi:hypothetical protein